VSERKLRRAHDRQVDRGAGSGRKLVLGAGAALGASVLFAPAAQADTFTVTSTADTNETEGTLREEIEDANESDGDDTIVFASSVTGTITLGGQIVIRYDSLDIQGPGADQLAISGDDSSRIFQAFDFDTADDAVTISGLTLTDGLADDGGVLYTFEASGFSPDVTIANSVLTGNESISSGGAIRTFYSAVTVTNSVISNNVAAEDGGAIYLYEANDDGSEAAALLIQNSQISGNEAGEEGAGIGLYAPQDEVVIQRTTISDNQGDPESTYGGGLWVGPSESDVTVDASTVSGNTAEYGGGIYLYRIEGDVTIQNSTVSGNEATDDDGGAGGVWIELDNGSATIRNSTITGNTAYYTGGVFFDDDIDGDEGPVEISSSIIANNVAYGDFDPNYYGAELGYDPQYDSSGFRVGFSLIEGSAAGVTQTPAGSNLLGVDPQLGPLASNGGPTPTHAPALASPVLDHGIGNGLSQDQRGVARTSDLALAANGAGSDGTDIGAVEIQASEVEAQCQATTVRRLAGTDGDDTLTGTDAAEALFGLAGNDSVSGAGGNDCVNGDAGRDNAKGGPGKDVVKGGGGKDRASGGGGKDKVTAQAKDKVSASCEKVVEKG
jgi:hypothetical protein